MYIWVAQLTGEVHDWTALAYFHLVLPFNHFVLGFMCRSGLRLVRGPNVSLWIGFHHLAGSGRCLDVA